MLCLCVGFAWTGCLWVGHISMYASFHWLTKQFRKVGNSIHIQNDSTFHKLARVLFHHATGDCISLFYFGYLRSCPYIDFCNEYTLYTKNGNERLLLLIHIFNDKNTEFTLYSYGYNYEYLNLCTSWYLSLNRSSSS